MVFLRMKNKFIFICLLGLSLFFSSCPMCEEESRAEYYSRNPYCVFYVHNKTNQIIYARIDGKFDNGKEARWIPEEHQQIKAGEMDSLCTLSQTPKGQTPQWIDLKRYAYRDSLLVSVFAEFEDMAGYRVGKANNTLLKQYAFAVEKMGTGKTIDIYYQGK